MRKTRIITSGRQELSFRSFTLEVRRRSNCNIVIILRTVALLRLPAQYATRPMPLLEGVASAQIIPSLLFLDEKMNKSRLFSPLLRTIPSCVYASRYLRIMTNGHRPRHKARYKEFLEMTFRYKLCCYGDCYHFSQRVTILFEKLTN